MAPIATTDDGDDKGGKVKRPLKRPRRRGPPTNTDVDQTSGSSSISNSNAREIQERPECAGPGRDAICSNPLDRLAQCLLKWKFVSSVSKGHKEDTNLVSGLRQGDSCTFSSSSAYTKHWETLLLEEIKAGIFSRVADSTRNVKECCGQLRASVVQLSATSRRYSLVKLHCSVGADCGPRESHGSNSVPNEMDLILLTGSVPSLPITQSNMSENPVSPSILALVTTSSRGDGLILSVRSDEWFEFTSSLSARASSQTVQGAKLDTHLVYYTILDSLMSPWREFNAVHSVHNMSLLGEVLGRSSPSLSPEGFIAPSNHVSVRDFPNLPSLPQTFSEKMKSRFNASQYRALHTAGSVRGSEMSSRRFSLIQGPPGTGKTSTVLGILNVLHLQKFNTYYEQVLLALLGPVGMRCRLSKDSSKWISELTQISAKYKPRILVTAPSNVAVDNVIEPILATGFVDGNGGTYRPSILRLGAGKSSRVQCISLEGAMKNFDALSAAECVIGAKDLRQRLEISLNFVKHLQAMLLSLVRAWQLCPDLPSGYELRVTVDTAKPYWVNHNTRTTSSDPPPRNSVSMSIKTELASSELLEKSDENPDDALGPPLTPRTPPMEDYDGDCSSLMSSPPTPPREDPTVECEVKEAENSDIQLSSSSLEETHTDPGDEDREFSRVFPSALRAVPEFGIHSRTLTSEVEKLYNMALQIGRLESRGQHGLKGGQGPGAARSSVRESRLAIETSVINDAHIVFTTLNSSGHPSLEGSEFDVAVVDEAAQCSEPSMLIPLRLGVKHCILVGDPKQLPATIFSDAVRKHNYSRSLFERLMESGHEYIMLDTQYRMHSEISAFPSARFYGAKLLDGENVRHPEYVPAYLRLGTARNNRLKPFMFIDLKSSRECGLSSGSRSSHSNLEEVRMCAKALSALVRESKCSGCALGSIGIITPYQNQLRELRRALTGMSRGLDIELNTVDAFQGREKDIIIVSTVRASESGNIGFLGDARRMNVALTRAKHGLFIIGRASTLQLNELWGGLIARAADSNALLHVESSAESIETIFGTSGNSSQTEDGEIE